VIAEALKFLAGIQTPKNEVTVTVDGQPYAVRSDNTLGNAILPVDTTPERPTLHVSTLSGLVAAYKAKIDKLEDRVGIVINDPFSVTLRDLDSDEFGNIQEYVVATHLEEKPFPFGRYLDTEDFILAMRAGFVYTENAVKIQTLCSTLCAGSGVAISDDGISQQVQTTTGTITKSSVQLPADGIPLVPHRTFRDANPVEAKFLLRMKGVKDSVPQVALFEIDPMWKLYTVASIRKYLEEQLPGAVIIS